MTLPACPAAYVRVAGATNAADPRVRDQTHAVLTAARRLGWPPPAVYAEVGVPGRHRPGSVLGHLAGYLANGRHDAVMVADLSRLSRNPADVLAFTVYCDRCQVALAAVAEGRIDGSRIAALYARRLDILARSPQLS